MQAAFIEQTGGIDRVQIGERPKPTAGAGEVVVQVRAAGMGPWDLGMMAGRFGNVSLPYIPGIEVAGVIEAVGDGVDFQPGDAVYGSTGFAGGGFSEYARVSANNLARKPEKLSFVDAAALVIGAGTAYEGLVDRLKLQPGETVLITAASGGGGTPAVQIAAAQGARVLAVASARHRDYLRRLGASATFDYHDPAWPEQARAAVPGGVDVLFDGAGGQTRDQALLAVRDGGRAAFIVGPAPQLERGISGASFSSRSTRQRLEAIAHLVETGKLRPEVEATYPLPQAREALQHMAARHTRGKIVLQVA